MPLRPLLLSQQELVVTQDMSAVSAEQANTLQGNSRARQLLS